MIERKNNEASLAKVEVNSNGGTLNIKSSHVDSLILAVEQAGNTGWNRVIGAESEGESVTLTLSKTEDSSIHLPTLRGSIRRKDLEAILTCNSSTEVSYSEDEYVPEVINDIPPPTLIEEEVEEEVKPKKKTKKKAVDSEEDKE